MIQIYLILVQYLGIAGNEREKKGTMLIIDKNING
jgi:hypothetical protein